MQSLSRVLSLSLNYTHRCRRCLKLYCSEDQGIEMCQSTHGWLHEASRCVFRWEDTLTKLSLRPLRKISSVIELLTPRLIPSSTRSSAGCRHVHSRQPI
eukprot:COSAG03_NODE_11800_length_575_cov_1.100840_1_plen_98_part_10